VTPSRRRPNDGNPLAGLARRAAIEADDRGVTETGIDDIEAGGVETSSSSIIHLSRYHLASALIGPGIGRMTPRKKTIDCDDQPR
jgi:hypothetical protein